MNNLIFKYNAWEPRYMSFIDLEKNNTQSNVLKWSNKYNMVATKEQCPYCSEEGNLLLHHGNTSVYIFDRYIWLSSNGTEEHQLSEEPINYCPKCGRRLN